MTAPSVRAAGPCPTCGGKAAPRHRPFCSPRCADVDLGRWLKETYRLASDETTSDETTTPDPNGADR